MSSSGELSESQQGGTGEVGARDHILSHLPSSDVPSHGLPSAVDGEELRRRLGEARARTQKLISDYVVSCVRLNREIARRREVAADRDQIRSELGACVARYALLLRAMGEPPERTLVMIKTAFNEAAPHQNDDNRAVLEDIVKWVVNAYYAA